MAFGEKISKQFVDALEGGHDSRAAVNLHNNEAGRLVRYDFTFTVVIQVFKKKSFLINPAQEKKSDVFIYCQCIYASKNARKRKSSRFL